MNLYAREKTYLSAVFKRTPNSKDQNRNIHHSTKSRNLLLLICLVEDCMSQNQSSCLVRRVFYAQVMLNGLAYKIQIQMEKMTLAVQGQILQTALMKQEAVGLGRWQERLNFTVAMISVIYLTITNSVVQASNIIFANIMLVDVYIQTHKTISTVLTWILLALSLQIVIIQLVMVLQRIRFGDTETNKLHLAFQKYIAYWLIFYEIILVPCSVLVITHTSDSSYPLRIVTFTLVAIIMYAFRIRLLYGQYFVVVIGAVMIASSQIFPLCLITLNLFILMQGYHNMRVYLLLNTAYDIVIFINAYCDTDITAFHLVIITMVIPAMEFFLPSQLLQSEHANEIIMSAIIKLHNEQSIPISQEWTIYKILHSFQEQAKGHDLIFEQKQEAIMQGLYKEMTKGALCCFLKAKLALDKAMNPTDLLLDIQSSEAQLYGAQFNMEMLTRIHMVSRTVEERGGFSERLRMMKLVHKLESQFLGEDVIGGMLVIRAQKYKQEFHSKVEQLLVLYTSLWRSAGRAKEEKMMRELEQLCRVEQQCVDLLAILKTYKEVRTQTMIFNSIQHKFCNSSQEQPAINSQHKEVLGDLGQTKFILVYNNQIVDISQQFSNQIQTKHSFLIGSEVLSIIPQQFHDYYRNHINKWLSSLSSSRIIVPFCSIQNPNIFFPFECTFRILPEISGGIKYLIHTRNSFTCLNESFLVYSLSMDRIVKLSKSFYDAYDVVEQDNLSLTAQELLGIDLTFLSNYTKAQASEQTVCQINLKKLEKKISSKMVTKHHQHVLKLVEIYQSRESRYFLLVITSKIDQNSGRSMSEAKIHDRLQLTEKKLSTREISDSITFCPIKNPYEEILYERLSLHRSIFSHSYMRTIIILFIIILVVGIIGFLLFNSVLSTSANTLSTKINDYSNEASKEQAIYVLFYQLYIYIHTLQYPNDFVMPNSKINVTQFQLQYQNKVRKNINSLLSMSVDSSARVDPIPFSIGYPNYTLVGQTSTTSLLPILEGIKKSLATSNFTFLLQNADIVDTFIESFVSIDTDILFQSQQQQRLSLLMGSVTLLIIIFIVKVQYMKIRTVTWSILDLHSKLTKEMIKEQLSHLSKFKEVVLMNGIDSKQQVKNNLQEHPSKILHNQIIEPVKKQKVFRTLMNDNLILLFILLFWLLFYYFCYRQMETFKGQVKSIVDYTGQIQLASRINTAYAENYYRQATQEMLPIDKRCEQKEHGDLQIPTLISQALPSSFDGFISQQADILTQNICKNANFISLARKDLLFSSMDCNQVLNGVLNNGFSEVFPYIIHKIMQHDQMLLSLLNQVYDSKTSTYPFFAQVIYSRRALDCIIGILNSAFKTEVSSYLTQKQIEFGNLMGYAMMLTMAVITMIVVYLWMMRVRCRVGRKCFAILPKKLIYNIKVSKFLIHSSLLDQIQYLSC